MFPLNSNGSKARCLEKLIKDKEAKQKDRVAALNLLQNLGKEAIPSLKNLTSCSDVEKSIKDRAGQF